MEEIDMETAMENDVTQYSQFCTKCEAHYLDVVGESCRCPFPKPEILLSENLLSKWQKGDFTL
jgi:hypothetical protein